MRPWGHTPIAHTSDYGRPRARHHKTRAVLRAALVQPGAGDTLVASELPGGALGLTLECVQAPVRECLCGAPQ